MLEYTINVGTIEESYPYIKNVKIYILKTLEQKINISTHFTGLRIPSACAINDRILYYQL